LLSLVWWYPDEYSLLQVLADGDADFVASYLRQDSSSVLQFAKYGLLKADSAEFAIGAVREFLRTEGETYKKAISPFSRTDIPPELLPQVPDLETLGELFRKRTEVEVRLRQAILLYLGVAFNWSQERMAREIVKALPKRGDRLDPSQIFVGRKLPDALNELYTADLKAIITSHWPVFEGLFGGRARFEMNMDTINIARRADAHSKPVTRQEAIEFNNSYAWMLSRLEPIPAGQPSI
jgi:hypothetical protein